MDSIQKIHNDLFEHLRTKYPDLRFKLRQSNRYNRLDKGYWFLGNDQYLGTSFWEGTDWQNKTPNIMLGVDLMDPQKPQTYLELVANDDEDKAIFFSKVSGPLQMIRQKRNGREINKWLKNYKTSSLKEAVDLFITTDKSIIDAFITAHQVKHLFPEIHLDEFKKQLREIKFPSIRRKRTMLGDLENLYLLQIQHEGGLMLKRLVIENIAKFKHLDILLHPRLSCFIGENGSGKTTILRALLLGLIGVDQNEYIGYNEGLADKLINMLKIEGPNQQGIEFSSKGRIMLYSNFQQEPTIVNFNLDNPGRPVLQDEGSFDFYIDEKGNFNKLIVGFSQIQGVVDNSRTYSSDKPHVGDVLPLLSNEPDGRGEALNKWIIALDHDASTKERYHQKFLERKLINRMFEIISDVTGQKIEFASINAQKQIIWVKIDEEIIPLNLVSQGFNNVFSWIGYFMKRLSETAPEGTEDPTQLPAICLIDEIDTYLHPKWQQTIVPALLKHFPNTQFIITTHSPIVVSNMEQGKLYKLEDGEAIEIPAGYFGKEYGLTLESIMGAPQRNEGVQNELNALFDLIDQEKFNAARKALLKLSEKYPDEPELSRAETMLTLLAD